MKEIQINIRVTQQDANEMKQISEVLDVPFSQIARQAIRKEIAELKRTDPRLQKTELPQAA